jgi:hypothetical protein
VCEDVDWIELADFLCSGGGQLWENCEPSGCMKVLNFLTTWVTTNFSRKTPYRAIT